MAPAPSRSHPQVKGRSRRDRVNDHDLVMVSPACGCQSPAQPVGVYKSVTAGTAEGTAVDAKLRHRGGPGAGRLPGSAAVGRGRRRRGSARWLTGDRRTRRTRRHRRLDRRVRRRVHGRRAGAIDRDRAPGVPRQHHRHRDGLVVVVPAVITIGVASPRDRFEQDGSPASTFRRLRPRG